MAGLEGCDAERALATVELLCRIPEGCAAVNSHALAVPLLVRAVLRVSERATEHAAGALLAVCSASEGAQREAVAAGVLTQLLLVVQSDCTERAKRKAQMLLKLLRDSWPHDSIANSDGYGGSDVVPF
ncbi:U-box domain-containing protein 26 [Striga hermonthica]|uniref:U-box domain-containing protein 26 n=1 Tax=Striga hermonthica TaxID=68872 RepID=A0A9N7MDZ6_STRHE|nr:U-box domain-containing protein 26 [Striga hermonthica]